MTSELATQLPRQELKQGTDDLDALWPSDEERERLERILGPYYRATLAAIDIILRGLLRDVIDPDDMVLTDAATNRVLAEAATRVVRIDETTRAAIRAQLQLGQLRGYSTWQIAHGVPADGYRGIDGLFQETWRGRADTVARTELQHASVVASRDRFVASGVVDRVRIIDGDDWDLTCADRNGEVVPLAQAPSLAHPNCLPGGQFVWAPNWQAGSARWYDGEVVVLRTAKNDLLTITPNHPVLTPTGWQPGGRLLKGHRIVRCADPKRIAALVDPDGEHRATPIEQVARAPRPTLTCSTATVPTSPEDFHGDGRHEQIDVVWTDRSAQPRFPSRPGDHTGERVVEITDAEAAGLSRFSAPNESLERVLVPPSGRVGGHRVGSALSGVASRFPDTSRLARVTSPAVLPNPCGDGGWMDAHEWRDLSNAHVLEDVEVVEIRRLPFEGHVYNLQTRQGWFIASNLMTHNCTLVLVPVLRDGLV